MKIREFLNGDLAALKEENPYGVFVIWSLRDVKETEHGGEEFQRDLAKDMTAVLNRGCGVELVHFIQESRDGLLKITWK